MVNTSIKKAQKKTITKRIIAQLGKNMLLSKEAAKVSTPNFSCSWTKLDHLLCKLE